MLWKIAIILIVLQSCAQESSSSDAQTSETIAQDSHARDLDTPRKSENIAIRQPNSGPERKVISDTSLTLDYKGHPIRVDILAPMGLENHPIKTVLLLHGWNLPNTEWCDKTSLCDSLVKAGYYVLMPDFGKSTYQWELYPETIEAYRKYPNREWMYANFLPKMRAMGLFDSTSFNAVIGLSTGGRGAALFALEKPLIFKACVALSADFDHSKLVDEPINNGFYGPIDQFPERWKGKDNIHNRAGEWSVPIYLGHGIDDKMCDVSQTKDFEDELRKQGFKHIISNYPKAGHNYDYWGSETQSILLFLSKYED